MGRQGEVVPVDHLLGGALARGAQFPQPRRRGRAEDPQLAQQPVAVRGAGPGGAEHLSLGVEQLQEVADLDAGEHAALGGQDHRGAAQRVRAGSFLCLAAGVAAQACELGEALRVAERGHGLGQVRVISGGQQPGQRRAHDVTADRCGQRPGHQPCPPAVLAQPLAGEPQPQLGDAQPAVRLAGVHAMAGLADDWAANRQTCIDVLCAYLRMPFEPDPGEGAPAAERLAFRAGREVRHTVIRVITAHLQPDASVSWRGYRFDFTSILFDGGTFAGAVFSGGTVDFGGAVFSGGTVDFGGAVFSGGTVNLRGAVISGGTVKFGGAVFSGGTVNFRGAVFSGGTADFRGAVFSGGTVKFGGAVFSGGTADFGRAVFSGGTADFGRAEFSGGTVNFGFAKFSGGTADFGFAVFSGGTADFGFAKFSGGTADFGRAVFSGGTVNFDSAEFSGGTVDFIFAVFSGGTVNFDSAEFSGGTVDFAGVADWSHPPELPPGPPDGVRLPGAAAQEPG